MYWTDALQVDIIEIEMKYKKISDQCIELNVFIKMQWWKCVDMALGLSTYALLSPFSEGS